MTGFYILGGLVSVGLFIYLLCALFFSLLNNACLAGILEAEFSVQTLPKSQGYVKVQLISRQNEAQPKIL